MAENKVEVEILAKLDTFQKQIDKLAKDTDARFEQLGGSISQALEGGIGKSLLSFAKQFAVVGVAIEGFKKALDSALEGEQLKTLDNQFEALTKQAGITGDTLRNNLVGAAAGLVDDTDLIKAANKALIELGGNANKIPQTLELARKATAVFGGEVAQNFEIINQAVATGNTRSLRALGLVIDQTEAVKKYAASLGVSVNSLNEAGKQQAILNAVLEKSEGAFKNIDPSANQAKTSIDRLTVAFKNVGDEIARASADRSSGFIASIADTITRALNGIDTNLKAAGTTSEATQAKIALLNTEFASLTRTIDNLQQRQAFDPRVTDSLEVAQDRIAKVRLQLSLLDEERRKANAIEIRPAAEAPSPFNVDKAKLDAIKIQEIVNKSNLDRINAQLAVTQQEDARDQLINEKKLASQQQFALQEQEFLLNNAINKTLSKDQENAALEQMEAQHQANLIAIQTDAAAKQIALSKQLGSIVNQGLAGAIAAGVQSMIQAIRNGGDALGAFVKTIAKSLGQVAISMGATLIAAGLGIESLKALQGGQAIAAGIALVALGSILSLLSGGGEGNTNPAPVGGGGAGGIAGTPTSAVVAQTEFNPAQQGTNIAVNVQGNILDRRESGLEIAQVIQEHFNNNGNLGIVGVT